MNLLLCIASHGVILFLMEMPSSQAIGDFGWPVERANDMMANFECPAPNAGSTCVFPFKYDRLWYYSCISTTRERPARYKGCWCSQDRFMPSNPPDQRTEPCKFRITNYKRSCPAGTPPKACVFPFSVGNETFYTCTRSSTKTGLRRGTYYPYCWCSTEKVYRDGTDIKCQI